jgi:hypothetical protein
MTHSDYRTCDGPTLAASVCSSALPRVISLTPNALTIGFNSTPEGLSFCRLARLDTRPLSFARTRRTPSQLVLICALLAVVGDVCGVLPSIVRLFLSGRETDFIQLTTYTLPVF